MSKHQKVILVTRWKQLTQQMILDAGQRVFETIFQRDPYLLSIIHLEHLQGTDGWRNHANFNLHAQRFSHTLTQCMQNIMEPYIAADLLQEFGAAYAEEEDSEMELRDNIPHSYWDRLSSAITSTVKELLDSLTPKGTTNHVDEIHSSLNVLPSPFSKSRVTKCIQHLKVFLFGTDGRNTLSVNDALLVNKDRLALQSNSTDICAWNVFAMFVSNQIRFGYEMERMLRAELRKLGLRNQRKTA
ncbi:unnamed protein product [Anisakis simplex]|uniref:Globin family profile domain-containing protein n=1 Tax=Anisakis simplex TaxID=6269 RepID=A0A3P6PT01_ANISI|nr:unnamed protein product [Anisakis simplex]